MPKSPNSYEPHLALMEISITPGGEWSPGCSRGWLMVQIASGSGYWLQDGINQELPKGTVMVLGHGLKGQIRASQLSCALVRFFHIDPARLSGLLSFDEQAFFNSAVVRKGLSFRLMAAADGLCLRLNDLCSESRSQGALMRTQLLQLFLECFADQLGSVSNRSEHYAGATDRLREFLGQLPPGELLHLDFSELVGKMLCTPRHLGRIFHEVVGMSFREKQTELRLTRACELLATTQAKVLDVALESGYQSLSLFNMMFKKRYGLTPGQWRAKAQATQPAGRSLPRLRVFRPFREAR